VVEVDPLVGLFGVAMSLLTSALLGALLLLWNLVPGFAMTSPDVTVLPQVVAVSSRSLLVVNTVYVLAVLAAGVVVMARENLQLRYGIGELAPRLVIGLVAANLATPLCRALIVGANAVTAALTGDSLLSAGGIIQLRNLLVAQLSPSLLSGPERTLVVLLSMLLLALTLMLIVTWVTRVGLLVVLTGIAPLALACHALPYTEGAARLWWRSMAAVLGVVVLQAFALHTTLAVFLSPQANLPALGLPGGPSDVLNLLIIACLLWATVRIPTLARRYVTGGRPNPGLALLRVLVVQQVTRGLARGLAGRAAAGRLARTPPPRGPGGSPRRMRWGP
jgi:hypothetical protein